MSSHDLEVIVDRWRFLLAEVPIKSNLDYVRLGEQAKLDMPMLLDELREARRPPLGYVVLEKRNRPTGYRGSYKPVHLIESGVLDLNRDEALYCFAVVNEQAEREGNFAPRILAGLWEVQL